MRGASRTSRTRGEMRWTRKARWTCAPDAYGEVVWFGRRGAGAKSGRSEGFSRGDGGKRAVLRGEHEVSRKAIAQGRPGCSRCPVCSCAVLFAQIARETAGAASTRSSLRPLNFEGKPRRKPRAQGVARSRRRAQPSSPALCAIVHWSGRSSIPETSMIEPKGRRVLDDDLGCLSPAGPAGP